MIKPGMIEIAQAYAKNGLSVIPADPETKYTTLPAWKPWMSVRMSARQIEHTFKDAPGIAIIAGTVSGNLLMIDFDNAGELFDAWMESLIKGLKDISILEKLVIERSQSGGFHVVFRCETPVSGNRKLAEGIRNGKRMALIETRGEGGLFLCAPTPGYELTQGSFSDIPVITKSQREVLIVAACALNEIESVIPAESSIKPLRMPVYGSEGLPGNDYNVSGDLQTLLTSHGWTLVHDGINQKWRRPGKDKGHSATFHKEKNVFYVFSSNAPQFEPEKGYSPFGVYAQLECGGDFRAAAKQLSEEGFGSGLPDPVNNRYYGVDLSQFVLPGDDNPLPEPEQQAEFAAKHISEVLSNPLVTDALPRISSTYPAIDEGLNGGFYASGMYLLAGLTGNGKSTLGANLARLMGRNMRLLYMNLEDDEDLCGRKLLAQESKMSIRNLESYTTVKHLSETAGGFEEAEKTRIEEAKLKLNKLPIWIESLETDLAKIEHIIGIHAAAGAACVIIDQASWISYASAKTEYEEASAISKRLKLVSKRLGILVIVLLQINRGGASTKTAGQDLQLHHIRSSGRWEQDADGTIIIQRIEEDGDDSNMIIDVKKHRHGPTGKRVTLAYQPEFGLLEDGECTWISEDKSDSLNAEQDTMIHDLKIMNPGIKQHEIQQALRAEYGKKAYSQGTISRRLKKIGR